MEFMNRGNQQVQPTHAPAPVGPSASPRGRGRGLNAFKGLRIASVVLLFAATILVIALVWLIMRGNVRSASEAQYIQKDRLQAVFLNGGQVYFGKIQDLNSKYLKMADIFYLRVNQVVQPDQANNQQAQQNDISLVKLGCELHRPSNDMLINREHVIFWENLKEEDGENTVPGAVKKYMAQYPEGQECQDQAQQGANNTNGTDN